MAGIGRRIKRRHTRHDMQAASLGEIFDLEGAVENAVKAIIEPLGVRVLTQRSMEEISWPYVAVQFTPGAWAGHDTVGNDGVYREAGWAGVLRLQVETYRAIGYAQHLDIRKLVRVAMSNPDAEFTEERLPFHEIALLSSNGSTHIIQTEADVDISELSYDAQVYVRHGAWPNQ
jgi:hypothetical protein